MRPDAAAPERVLCIIGGGPRGASVLERLGAALGATDLGPSIRVHVVEPCPPGPGRVWRVDQSPSLSMNTLAGSVTMFADRGAGPVAGAAGPSFLDWAHDIAPRTPALDEVLRAEAARLRPESHASRPLYGAYLAWFFDEAVRRLPSAVEVVVHRTRAAGLRIDGERELVDLDDGTTIAADAVVLATGWLPRVLTAVESSTATVWIAPGHPADQALDRIPPLADLLVRGLGMGFFDALSLLGDRFGGRYEEGERGVRYLPGGGEPVITAVSGRGLPFLAKSMHGGLPPAPVLRRLREVLAGDTVTFDDEVWSALLRDVHEAFHRRRESRGVLEAGTTDAVAALLDAMPDVPYDLRSADAAVARALEGLGPIERLDLASTFSLPHDLDAAAVDGVVAARASADLDDALSGDASARKAALWEFSAARPLLARAFEFAGPAAEHERAYGAYLADAGFAGSGPPAQRVAHMLAWRDAGLLRFGGALRHGETADHDVVLDAWLPMHDVRSSADPVLRDLVGAGRMRPHVRPGAAGPVETSGVAVDRASGRVLHADGSPDPRVWLIGIPLEATRGDTIIAPLIGADSTLLRETDLVARNIVATLAEPRRHSTPAPA